MEDFEQRDGRWLISDLSGKAGHVRTVPVPGWVKTAVDAWAQPAGINDGFVFRAVNKADQIWSDRVSTKAIWAIVRNRATASGLKNVAPHDLRRTCARLCRDAGGELDQIQFLLGHISVRTTERYLGCKQKLRDAVNDRILLDLHP
jgi:integrase